MYTQRRHQRSWVFQKWYGPVKKKIEYIADVVDTHFATIHAPYHGVLWLMTLGLSTLLNCFVYVSYLLRNPASASEITSVYPQRLFRVGSSMTSFAPSFWMKKLHRTTLLKESMWSRYNIRNRKCPHLEFVDNCSHGTEYFWLSCSRYVTLVIH